MKMANNETGQLAKARNHKVDWKFLPSNKMQQTNILGDVRLADLSTTRIISDPPKITKDLGKGDGITIFDSIMMI